MNEYRCTRNAPYLHDCAGRNNPSAREGYYIRTDNEQAALHEMMMRFPQESQQGFTVELWKENVANRAKPIIQSLPVPHQPGLAPGEITLREWRQGEEWVTHFHNLQDKGFYYGHYFTDFQDAVNDFHTRVQEYTERAKPETDSNSFSQPNEAITMPSHIFEVIKAVRESGTTNMFDLEMVKRQAAALGYPNLEDWINTNKSSYFNGILWGFTPTEEF